MGETWAYDFVFDACANGQQLKCLTVIDEFTRETLAIDVVGSIRSNRVIEARQRIRSSLRNRTVFVCQRRQVDHGKIKYLACMWLLNPTCVLAPSPISNSIDASED